MEYKDFEHTLKPYYNYTEEEAKAYEYFKDFMYLMHPNRGKQLFNLGLPVYLLYTDNRQLRVKEASQLDFTNCACGIEKEAWQKFLHTDKGAAFTCAWDNVVNMAYHAKDKLENDRKVFLGEFYDYIYQTEDLALTDYFGERYKYLGKSPEISGDKKRNFYFYVPLIFEYAQIIYEAFTAVNSTSLTLEAVASAMIQEYLYSPD